MSVNSTKQPVHRLQRRRSALLPPNWPDIDRKSAFLIAPSMRGLAFPTNAVFDREASYEYGTPSTNVDDIPIDPALRGDLVIDPSLMPEVIPPLYDEVQPVQFPEQSLPPPIEDEYSRAHQYAEGPQGDPFAPQPIPPYLQLEQPRIPTPPLKPVKRRRKIRREEDCGFCQGNDAKNKAGEAEQMVTCSECGRSGHPSCMELPGLGDIMRSYPWRCMECKICEVCLQKGDDDRILFCDCCDRGWHMYCINPPMQDPPEGKWHCPMCPPESPDDPALYGHSHRNMTLPSSSSARGTSLASSSRSVAQPSKRGKGKSRQRAGKGVAEDFNDSPTARKSRPRGKPGKRGNARVSVAQEEEEESEQSGAEEEEEEEGDVEGEEEEEDEEVEVVATPRAPRPRKRKRANDRSPGTSIPRVRLRIPPQREREKVEEEPRLFDELLSVEDRDTQKTIIMNSDKVRFERSRMIAEEKLAPPPPPPQTASSIQSDTQDIYAPGPSRPLRSATLQHFPNNPVSTPTGPAASPVPSTPGPLSKDSTALRIRTIRFGHFDIKTWYDAPFPEEYANIPDGRLWICEFCLKYMKSKFGAGRHRMKCKARHPPGDEIYRDGVVSIFEVDGRRNKIYCQNLCLLSKMFLDHKSLFYDVEPFLFYVITEVDDLGARFVGYFSKEKRSPKDYNLSCIMTLPVRQRQGWGNLLIDFSYLLSKIEQLSGSPEKPLSSLGALGYRNYWKLAVMRYLENAPDQVRLEDISAHTSMTFEDICDTLIHLNMIYIRESSPPPIRPSPGQSIKFPKGRKNGVARRHLQRMQTMDKDSDAPKGPFVPPKDYEIRFDREQVSNFLRSWEAKGYFTLKPEKLQWTPYLLSRADKVEGQGNIETPALGSLNQAALTPVRFNGTRADHSADGSTAPENGRVESVRSSEGSLPPADKPTTDSPAALFDDDDELPVAVVRKTRTPRSKTRAVAKQEDTPTLRGMAIDDVPRRHLRSGQNSTPTRKAAVAAVLTPSRDKRSRINGRTTTTVNDDEALAAKLALEERMHGGRRLRSGTGGGEIKVERKRQASTSTPSRKRRRLSEAGDSATPEPSSVEPLSLNGVHVNGNGAPSTAAHSPTQTLAEGGSDSGRKSEQAAVSEQRPKVEEMHASQEPGGMQNVKLEEAGSPLAMTGSRHSVPSDDTMFSPDTMQDKIRGHAESDLRSTLAGEDGEDANADGEYDEDAEGEPDTELFGEDYRFG